MARFSNETKTRILAMLIRSASANGGTPDYRQVLIDHDGERTPSFWTLRKWFEIHAATSEKQRERRELAPVAPADVVETPQIDGDVLAFPGVAPPASRVPVFSGPDLTAMDRATFHKHMLGRLYETLDLATATPLTLSSVKGLTQQLEHHFESATGAANDAPDAIDDAAFIERLECDWSAAPDQYLEALLSLYARRHGIRLVAIRPGADDTRELTASGWQPGPAIVASAAS